MNDYAHSVARRTAQQQAKFRLTPHQAKRVDQQSQLDNHYLKQKEGITDAEQLEKITAAYQRAKQALQAGWAQEDHQQSNWLSGM